MNKTLNIPPVEDNAVPIPALTDTSSEIYICFEDIGQEVFSDISGGFTVGKRLAMAYAKITRTASSFAGISNPLKAFVITKACKSGPHLKIFVRLKETAEIMKLPAADEKFVVRIPDQPVLGQGRGVRYEVAAINYGLLSRMSRYGDCPHCGQFIGTYELAYQETNAGKRQVATCASCGTTMKAYYS